MQASEKFSWFKWLGLEDISWEDVEISTALLVGKKVYKLMIRIPSSSAGILRVCHTVFPYMLFSFTGTKSRLLHLYRSCTWKKFLLLMMESQFQDPGSGSVTLSAVKVNNDTMRCNTVTVQLFLFFLLLLVVVVVFGIPGHNACVVLVKKKNNSRPNK